MLMSCYLAHICLCLIESTSEPPSPDVGKDTTSNLLPSMGKVHAQGSAQALQGWSLWPLIGKALSSILCCNRIKQSPAVPGLHAFMLTLFFLSSLRYLLHHKENERVGNWSLKSMFGTKTDKWWCERSLGCLEVGHLSPLSASSLSHYSLHLSPEWNDKKCQMKFGKDVKAGCEGLWAWCVRVCNVTLQTYLMSHGIFMCAKHIVLKYCGITWAWKYMFWFDIS